jgi:hypothetical protein
MTRVGWLLHRYLDALVLGFGVALGVIWAFKSRPLTGTAIAAVLGSVAFFVFLMNRISLAADPAREPCTYCAQPVGVRAEKCPHCGFKLA